MFLFHLRSAVQTACSPELMCVSKAHLFMPLLLVFDLFYLLFAFVFPGTNLCSNNNGDCSQLCLPTSPTTRSCMCTAGYSLRRGQQSCEGMMLPYPCHMPDFRQSWIYEAMNVKWCHAQKWIFYLFAVGVGSFLLYSVHEGIRGIPLDPSDKSDALVPVSGTSLAVGIDFHAGKKFSSSAYFV